MPEDGGIGFGGAALIASAGMAASGIGARAARGWQRRENKRAWTRTMKADNTKVQRGMRDARAAGLNPILYASGGMSMGKAPQASASASASGSPLDAPANINAGIHAASAGAAYRNIKKQGKILDEGFWKAHHDAVAAGQHVTINRPTVEQAVYDSNTNQTEKGRKLMDRKRQINVYAPAASAAGSLIRSVR